MWIRGSDGQTENYLSFYEFSGHQWNMGTYGQAYFAIWKNGEGLPALFSSGYSLGVATTNPSYTLHVNGYSYSVGYYGGSDIRWKKNIMPLENSLENVLKLQGVNYEWRVDEYKDRNFERGKQVGLIAQEVEQVIPELVHTDKEGYKSVSYEKLTAVLIEAVKEQQKKIKELEDRISALEK